MSALVEKASEAVEAAMEDLGTLGEMLGYLLSCRLVVDDVAGIRAMARELNAYADARDQLKEALRIAEWNRKQEAEKKAEVSR